MHICVGMALSSKTLRVYQDGAFKEQKDIGNVPANVLLGGGALYFGQDQDGINGGFDKNQSYK